MRLGTIAALINKKTGFSVTFNDLDKSLVYPSYNALPEPAQVFDMVRHEKPLSSASGNNVTISTAD